MTVANDTPYKTIEIAIDETPFQRNIPRSKKFTTTSEAFKNLDASGALIMNSKLPVRGPPGGLNPKPTNIISNNLPSSCDRLHYPIFATILCPSSSTGT